MCKRASFVNPLGFLDHCRVNHNLGFSTHEDAAMHCGVLVDETTVPADDPARARVPLLHSLAVLRSMKEEAGPQLPYDQPPLTPYAPHHEFSTLPPGASTQRDLVSNLHGLADMYAAPLITRWPCVCVLAHCLLQAR